MKKLVAYVCKCVYLILSWWFIVYTCYGELNVNLLCSSIFIYSGGVALDSLFYFFESLNSNTILRWSNILFSGVSLMSNLAIAIVCMLIRGFIIIPYNETKKLYTIMLDNTVPNGFSTLYPDLASFKMGLRPFMTVIMLVSLFSLIPALLLEFDSRMKIKNDRYALNQHKNNKKKGR